MLFKRLIIHVIKNIDKTLCSEFRDQIGSFVLTAYQIKRTKVK